MPPAPPRDRAWNKPGPITDKPDLEITKGKQTISGTGPCVHSAWTFSTGAATYTILELSCTLADPPKGAKGDLIIDIKGKPSITHWCF